ncbi:MAG: hypothetical protein ABSG34_16425 [Candidatus Sulfotelmatobacter sp.]|jgi:hypothetical protein
MKTLVIILASMLLCLTACNKASGPAAILGAAPAVLKSGVLEQKLQEYSGAPATNCGQLDVGATADQSKTASDCAVQASQGKHAFYVAYDMPGMSVGVAGNADGKLFTVQSQNGAMTAGDCPSQLRVASSGRVTCFAPGDMGSMGAGHGAGAMSPGEPNPHSAPKMN